MKIYMIIMLQYIIKIKSYQSINYEDDKGNEVHLGLFFIKPLLGKIILAELLNPYSKDKYKFHFSYLYLTKNSIDFETKKFKNFITKKHLYRLYNVPVKSKKYIEFKIDEVNFDNKYMYSRNILVFRHDNATNENSVNEF